MSRSIGLIVKAVVLSLVLVLTSCGGTDSNKAEKQDSRELLKEVPAFDAKNAYNFVKQQVDFGPRVPNTEAHERASVWLKEQFESFGAKVYMQAFQSPHYTGQELNLVNIIASFNPKAKKRILLAAHWDTRPFADQDPIDKQASLDGANDGASGVGVLMEVARVLGANEGPAVGVDIILFDGEDWGEHDEIAAVSKPDGLESWWCLGSQYWSKNKHIANYSAFYGVLLDMVGAPNATFYYDEVSQKSAARIQEKVWDLGVRLGYGNHFKPRLGFRGITDDHVYVNDHARIPMIDIIDHRPGGDNREFTPAWHRQSDGMENIDMKTLEAVGVVLLILLYNE